VGRCTSPQAPHCWRFVRDHSDFAMCFTLVQMSEAWRVRSLETGMTQRADNARVRNRGVTDIRLGICPLIVSTRSSDEKAGEVGDNVIRLCL
jgi:hypothetical protein